MSGSDAAALADLAWAVIGEIVSMGLMVAAAALAALAMGFAARSACLLVSAAARAARKAGWLPGPRGKTNPKREDAET